MLIVNEFQTPYTDPRIFPTHVGVKKKIMS